VSEGASPPPPKIDLLDMILWAEAEADDVEIWRDVLRREGKDLWPAVARRGQIARKAVETLTLVKEFERDFVQMIKSRREAQRRRGHAHADRNQATRQHGERTGEAVLPAQDHHRAVDATAGDSDDD
jgi:hypothetical protein